MKITNGKLFFHVIKSNVLSGNPVEITSDELQYFKCDNALERAIAEKTNDFVFAQSCVFIDIDGKSVRLELTFDLMNRTEYQVLLIASQRTRKFLQNFFDIKTGGVK